MIVPFGKGPRELTGPIIDGYVLRQSFTARDSHLRSVNVLLSTYKRRNKGNLVAEIVDFHNKSLKRDQVAACDLVDNRKHEFRFDVKLNPGGRYEFRIRTVHCRSAQAPTAHYASCRHAGNHLFVAGRLCRHKELVCDFCYAGDNPVAEVPSEVVAKFDSAVEKFVKNTNDLLSIIILTKDQFDLISKCVQRITETVKCPYEVLIGDTGSVDERVLGLYEDLPENFRVVRGMKYHFSKANNELVRQAKGGYLLFLNNDVFLEENTVEYMMDYARIFSVGAVGVRLMKQWGTIDHDGQIIFDDAGKLTGPGHVHMNHVPGNLRNDDSITDGVTAACMLMRQDTFVRMGGFDEAYQDIYQDCDMCMKLRRDGYLCVTARRVTAVHVGSATRGTTGGEDPKVKADRALFYSRWKDAYKQQNPVMSFITCCNNPQLYMNMMKSLPDRHSGFAEFVPIQNHDNRFTVTEALNLGAALSLGEHKVYCHQDVLFGDGWMGSVVAELEMLSEAGVVGFEGVQDGGKPASCKNVEGYMPTQTIDELCLIVPYGRFTFDTRFKFHYYGADICMQAIKAGRTNFVIGAPIKHLSGGRENIDADIAGFKKEAKTFSEKWKGHHVWTTTTRFLGSIRFDIMPEVLNA